jgi:hypothetical protein
MRRGEKEYTITVIPSEQRLSEEEVYDRLTPILEEIILDLELKYTSDQLYAMYDKIKDKMTKQYGDIDDYFKR